MNDDFRTPTIDVRPSGFMARCKKRDMRLVMDALRGGYDGMVGKSFGSGARRAGIDAQGKEGAP